jgi:polar amino acid transport system ATP-binding protein
VLSIVGPSGSGKSTILRCINRLEVPSSGYVYLDDEKITGKNLVKLRKKIGIVFQHFNLFPHMDVMENLTYAPINVLKMKEKDAREKARDFLERFGLREKGLSMPKNLSGGTKTKGIYYTKPYDESRNYVI